MALGSGGKIAGLPRNAVIAGAAALVIGVAYFWWRSRKAGTGTDTSALAPSPAGDGTAGGMTDNFFITIQEQQGTVPHGPRPHKHPHPKQHHQRQNGDGSSFGPGGKGGQPAGGAGGPPVGGRGGFGGPPAGRR